MAVENFVVERFDPDEYIRQKDNEERVGQIIILIRCFGSIPFDEDPVKIDLDPVSWVQTQFTII